MVYRAVKTGLRALCLHFWMPLLASDNDSKILLEVLGFNSLNFPNSFEINSHFILINCMYTIMFNLIIL